MCSRKRRLAEIRPPSCASSIALVVVRDVLHEMNIIETGRLFAALNEHLLESAEVYVQDMASLPRAERGR